MPRTPVAHLPVFEIQEFPVAVVDLPLSDASLWEQIGRRRRPAVLEAFRRHGEVAFAVAQAITQDAQRAEQAVVASFVRLATDARWNEPRSLRVEVLDAVLSCARPLGYDLVNGTGPAAAPVAGDVYRTAPADVRDVLALAVAGRCSCAEIAEILAVDEASVHRRVLVGLHHARALLGPPAP